MCNEEDRGINAAWVWDCQPRDRLFCRFSVFHNVFEEYPWNEETGTEAKVSLEPETRPSFVLIPFEEDGKVYDRCAIEALRTYARETRNPSLQGEIEQWIETGKPPMDLNVPHPESAAAEYYA